MNLKASRATGAVSFEELPIGAPFFFAGEYTRSSTKVGPTSYRRYPEDRWASHLRIDYLVYPDPSHYLS